MKKITISLLGLAMSSIAAAEPSIGCNYRDYFRLSDNTHPGVYIVRASTTPELFLGVIGPRSFEIRDTPLCKLGYAHVTVAYDENNWCVLDIKDGPYMLHPSVKASCQGMIYKNTTYDGFNSYSYTINLD